MGMGAAQNLSLIHIFITHVTLFKELLSRLDQITGILNPGSLVRRMHGKLRKADIHGVKRHFCIGDISKCGASQNVGTVCKCLERHTCLPAQILEYGSKMCIRDSLW